MKKLFKVSGILAFAFGLLFIGANSTNAQTNRQKANREYRENIRDAKRDYQKDIRKGKSVREALRDYNEELRDAKRDYRRDTNNRVTRRTRNNRYQKLQNRGYYRNGRYYIRRF